MSEEKSADEKIKDLESQLNAANKELERISKCLMKTQSERDKLSRQCIAAENRISLLSVRLVEKQERIDLLEIHALEEPLTGLYNRRYADLQASRFENAVSSRVLCVIVIDINYLKRINDSCGHEAGDQLLVAFSKKLQEFPGENKTVARIGGDEFLIIKAKDDKKQATAYCEMIRNTLNVGFKCTVAGGEIFCTASVGFDIHVLDGNFSFNDLWISADLDMYKNKTRSREVNI
ncbi:MAG: hypothetical protein US63_C0002G0034 [Candidatus Moranbacteria bacterium GW2011_GWC2_37_8]|nr:MAG: hypothetical protein US63_C0002G0034 [Candidatus Moranbacteria bacterium GW2011_GWC2_37_8]KKQ62744.1 MAG: Diguanylate cyclase with PAS/PAC sensor [Parcubacteria group bacterium GW2011_GWC1_38_22]KKQ81374.1 MAG: hypothetical protein UT03_C0004G0013 [Candidatus Moranbacteria bacterium GW2011_GWD2_38_7]